MDLRCTSHMPRDVFSVSIFMLAACLLYAGRMFLKFHLLVLACCCSFPDTMNDGGRPGTVLATS